MLRQALVPPFLPPEPRPPPPAPARTLSKDLPINVGKPGLCCFLGFAFPEGKTKHAQLQHVEEPKKKISVPGTFFFLSSLISLEEKQSWFFPGVEGKRQMLKSSPALLLTGCVTLSNSLPPGP